MSDPPPQKPDEIPVFRISEVPAAVVVDLHLVTPKPSDAMVKDVEDILARVRSGEVLGLAVAMNVRGKCTGSVFRLDPGADIAHLITAIERLKLRLLAYEGE